MEWHPFAEKFPLLEGEERDLFKSSIAETKGNEEPVKYRIKDGKKQGLDGRNRFRACSELKLKCKMLRVNVPDDQVKLFIARRNIHRRHMTRELRQQIILEMREDGVSTRQIADAIGVNQSTVVRTIAASSGDALASTDAKNIEESGKKSETIVGADGKTYPATKPKILCARCQRVGAVKDCADCKEARAAAKSKPKPTLSEETTAAASEEETDTQPTMTEVIKAKNAELEAWCRGLMDYAKTMPEDPWLDDLNRREGAQQKLRNVCDTIRSAKCHCVCPKCRGDGCRTCKDTGRITKAKKDML